MYFLNYLVKSFETAVLLIGLNGSAEMMSIHDANDFIDSQAQKIEHDYEIPVDEALINKAKRQIFRLSSQGETLVQLVNKLAVTLEQETVFRWPNETIELPQLLKNLGYIYHFKANRQRDFTSCGYWSAANAKALDCCLNPSNEEQSSLNIEVTNQLSANIIQQLFATHTPILLSPEQVNHLALKIDSFRLNKLSFSQLVQACTIKNNDEYDEGSFSSVGENGLHIVSLLANEVSPCCFSNNQSVALEKNRVIAIALEKLKKSGYLGFVNFLVKRLAHISKEIEPLTEEQIEQEKTHIPEIDWAYLDTLIEHLDQGDRNSILGFIAGYKFALINKSYFKKTMNSLKMPEIEDTVDLFNYDNNKLLTLCNLTWAIMSYYDKKKLDNLMNDGPISRLVYFKALADNFKALNNNQRGALHFACYVGTHWILISVIKIENRKPIIAVFDSMNDPISSNLRSDDMSENIDELCEWVKHHENDPDKSKILYILYFYDLFINGNTDKIKRELKIELRRLSLLEKGDESGPDLENERQLKLAVAASLKNNPSSNDGMNSLVFKGDESDADLNAAIVASLDERPPSDDDIHRLSRLVVQNGLDCTPNEKGKEKKQNGRNGYHSDETDKRLNDDVGEKHYDGGL